MSPILKQIYYINDLFRLLLFQLFLSMLLKQLFQLNILIHLFLFPYIISIMSFDIY